ncbi:MAG: GDP-mannose 4,6-dehydratase [Brevinemataceae bacterium]
MKKVVFITGITGQDGSYLAEQLLDKGCEVHGMLRRSSSFNTERIEHLYIDKLLQHKVSNLNLHYGDLTDFTSIFFILNKVRPSEIYHLGAQSHVKVSFEMPEYTADSIALGALRLFEAVRALKMEKEVKIYNAVTSELYGKVQEVPQSETTPFYPRSPYGVAKQYAFWIAKNFRESYNMHISNGILFNHESERRGETFVTRKITIGIGDILAGLTDKISLGNLDAQRDWGYAPDYTEGMYQILQLDYADDFVLATGEMHSVREFCTKAFAEAGITIEWKDKGINEKGYDKSNGRMLVDVNPKYFRPAEVEQLLGNPAKAIKALNWNPTKTSFDTLVKKMVQSDIKLSAEKAKKLRG